jgi:uncharacterized protein
MVILGIIADTHGLLRPEALDALSGSDLILHAGDIGGPDVLARLSSLAPVHAVRGNVDTDPRSRNLPDYLLLRIEGVRLLLVHHRADARNADSDSPDVVVFGHSHRPLIHYEDGYEHKTLLFNPGSAGPRRFRLPVSVGRLAIDGASLLPEILTLSA